MTMVSEIKEKIFENCTLPIRSSQRGLLTNNAPLLTKSNKPLNVEVSPDVFGQENSGRLVAKFLLSFITWSEKHGVEAGSSFQGNLDTLVQGNSEKMPAKGEGMEMIQGIMA